MVRLNAEKCLKVQKINECGEDIFISYRNFENHEQIYEK